jgi:branched-chain amino acid transport system substrate-binding protein
VTDPGQAGKPILVGVFYDFPQHDGGAGFEEAVRIGLAEVAATGRLDREVELVAVQADGLPAGTAHDLEQRFRGLVDQGPLAILGPSISDNGYIIRELADELRVPCINYTGGELTRSEWMFHYQIGSLEEEPVVLAQHIDRVGLRTIAVIYDNSPVGRRYLEYLGEACGVLGIDIVGTAAISPLTEDLVSVAKRLQVASPQALVYLGLGVAARAVALAVAELGWELPVVANSSLMFGYARPDWRDGWEGWVYIDGIADENRVRAALRERSKASAGGPIGCAAYDMGRLIGEAVARAAHLTRAGIRDGLERIKRMPAASGVDGTFMGFGNQDHAALKGDYLVLRTWKGGRTIQV